MGDGFDQQQLLGALAGALEVAAWSDPSSLAANGVHDGYRRINVVLAGRRQPAAAPLRFVVDRYAPVSAAWLSMLEPGGFIRPHRDAGPWFRRWHVPIVAAGTITTDGDTYTPQAGVPFEVQHWRCHSLTNDTDRRRVHLVLDTTVRVDEPHAPFALCLEEARNG